MIVQEDYDARLVRTYSDVEGMGIRQVETDIVYVEAIDVKPCRYTYEEAPLDA